ncbi:MAG: adenylate/guanylate cyclase domain-containing protein [Fibrobacterota bacterium]
MTNTRQRIEAITSPDVSRLNDYIRRHNTAVLVIMFTDIEGFTAITENQGERYSAQLRKHHDEIVVPCVEKNDAGMVIKFIGDAVMAVFSEPHRAVESALAIQEKLAAFNTTHSELMDIRVRIGLHMGQVAVEKSIQSDVFGRHVNRASRVESLAAGTQIYVTESVFDSAKGWLQECRDIAWKCHGRYYLKGIARPAEIYEVYTPARQKPKPPRAGKREKRQGTVFITALFTALIIGLILFFIQKSRETPEIYYHDYNFSVPVIADSGDTLQFRDNDTARGLLSTNLSRGRHILYYDISPMVRYYAPIEIGPEENHLTPKFTHFQLPEITLRAANTGDRAIRKKSEGVRSFSYYTNAGELREDTLTYRMLIEGRPAGADSLHYTVTAEGTLGAQDFSTTFMRTAPRSRRRNSIKIDKELLDTAHYYLSARLRESGPFAQFTLALSWK